MSAPAEPGSIFPGPCRVRWARPETPDTVTLALDPVGVRPQPFAPGQFNMLYAFGVGEVPISVSGDPAAGGPLLHTVRAVGAVTQAICAAEPGQVLGLRGPFGSSWEIEAAEGRDVVIVAGGIGLAPLRSAVYGVLSRRDRYGEVALLVGARSPADLLYRDEMETWRAAIHVGVTVDHADTAWPGSVGVVTELLPGATFDPGRATALICGPEVMMRVAARALADMGVSPERIRVSLERNMKCAVGHCGHCQLGPAFVCKDGPVLPYAQMERLMAIREV